MSSPKPALLPRMRIEHEREEYDVDVWGTAGARERPTTAVGGTRDGGGERGVSSVVVVVVMEEEEAGWLGKIPAALGDPEICLLERRGPTHSRILMSMRMGWGKVPEGTGVCVFARALNLAELFI